MTHHGGPSGSTHFAALQQEIAAQPAAQRLRHVLRLAERFELEIATCPTPLYAVALIGWLTDQLADGGRPVLRLSAAALQPGVTMHDVIRTILEPLAHATGRPLVFLDLSPAREEDLATWRWMLHRLNERRNGIAASLASPVVLLLAPWLEPVLPAEAPDLWSIRSTTIELVASAALRRDPRAMGRRSSDLDLEALEHRAKLRAQNADSGSIGDRRAYASALWQISDAGVDRIDPARLEHRARGRARDGAPPSRCPPSCRGCWRGQARMARRACNSRCGAGVGSGCSLRLRFVPPGSSPGRRSRSLRSRWRTTARARRPR